MLVSAIAFSIAFATILLAHIFERFGYAPCPLCLQERYAYYFGVPALIIAFFAARAESFTLTRIVLALVALAFLGGRVTERSGRILGGARCELRRGTPGGGFFEHLPSETLPIAAATSTGSSKYP